MYKDKKILALIPARGGSKGLPGKNIKPFCGKPLIAYSVTASRKSRYIDRTIVSTDDKKIAEAAVKTGADIPFLRPPKLAGDKSTSMNVIIHALKELENAGDSYDMVILLQPTSPLRTSSDIDRAIKFYFDKKADVVVSVSECSVSPLWMNTLPATLIMDRFMPKGIINKARQDLPAYFHPNGAIFIADISFLKKNKTFYGKKTYAYIMPKQKSIDIDDIMDFRCAETIHQNKLNSYGK